MGFKTTLTIKHIAGWTFKIDCERDADVLGIKLLIWEQQHIPINTQRIIHGGREMNDNAKISSYGIKDGDMLFLVESQKVNQQEQQISAPVTVEPIPITTTAQVPQVQQPVASDFHINVATQDDSYQFLDVDNSSENEFKVRTVVKLSCCIRAYLILGLVVSLYSAIFCCLFALIPFLFYFFGIIGTKKLNKCLLVFPVILTFLIGFGGLILNILYWQNTWFHLIHLLISIMHIIIFLSISKLICKISKLNKTEYRQARTRIASGCCC